MVYPESQNKEKQQEFNQLIRECIIYDFNSERAESYFFQLYYN